MEKEIIRKTRNVLLGDSMKRKTRGAIPGINIHRTTSKKLTVGRKAGIIPGINIGGRSSKKQSNPNVPRLFRSTGKRRKN